MFIDYRCTLDTLLEVAAALFRHAGDIEVQHGKDGRIHLVLPVGEGHPDRTKKRADGRTMVVEVAEGGGLGVFDGSRSDLIVRGDEEGGG